ncbi:(d)CMP kinase [Candidatus Woesearchaeota archaeon]|nr:(d)CMP kinase [Candidatus Woesearchaeota archaeon]
MVDTSYKNKKFIIAIDGSSWVGKSTVAKALANLLGYDYLKTGTIFRAIANKILDNHLKETQIKEIVELVRSTDIDFKDGKLIIDNQITDKEIQRAEVVHFASKIAVIEELRDILTERIRVIGNKGGFIIEGRDTGTKMFPNADWKFFLVASLDIKVKRFFKTMPENEKDKYSEDEGRKIVADIDKKDRERKIAPLAKAPDAIVYDNTDSPSAEEDAAVLKNYITNWKEIEENSEIISKVMKK